MNRTATYPMPAFGRRPSQASPQAPATAAQAPAAYAWLPAHVRANLTPRALRLMRSGD